MDSAIDPSKVLSDIEFARWVKATRKLGIYGIALRLMVVLGCRVSELLLLRPGDVDLSRQAIRVPTLKRDGRPVRTILLFGAPLDQSVLKDLRSMLTKVDPMDPLFPTTKRTLQRKLVQTFESVGIRQSKTGCTHILRHTRASQFVSAGMDWNSVRSFMGWSSLAMAKRYVHADEATLRKIGARLPKI